MTLKLFPPFSLRAIISGIGSLLIQNIFPGQTSCIIRSLLLNPPIYTYTDIITLLYTPRRSLLDMLSLYINNDLQG